jgi:hypothetical protein
MYDYQLSAATGAAHRELLLSQGARHSRHSPRPHRTRSSRIRWFRTRRLAAAP